MRIQPNDVGHFKSAAQAEAYDKSQKVIEDFRLLCEDVVSLDNSPLDSNQDLGKVVFDGKNLLPLTHRESRTHIQVPGGKSTYPTDPVYWTEKRASGEAELASKKVTSLNLTGNHYHYDLHQSQGFLGLFAPRTVYVKETEGANRRYVRETVSRFADGTIDYKSSNLLH